MARKKPLCAFLPFDLYAAGERLTAKNALDKGGPPDVKKYTLKRILTSLFTLLAILLPAQRWFGGASLGSVINPIAYQSEYFGIGLLISWALWAVLILYVVLALRHTRWQKYTPLALGWTVLLGLHRWLAPLWKVLGGAEAASWYYPVVSGLINLLAAAVVLLTVRAIYRARREKKSA